MHEYRNDETELSLSDLLKRMAPADVILVEGFKGASIPKIELRRRQSKSDPLTDRIPGIVAIASDEPDRETPTDLPVFHLDNIENIGCFIENHLGLERPGDMAEQVSQ